LFRKNIGARLGFPAAQIRDQQHLQTALWSISRHSSPQFRRQRSQRSDYSPLRDIVDRTGVRAFTSPRAQPPAVYINPRPHNRLQYQPRMFLSARSEHG
jgi:hypothetical protein